MYVVVWQNGNALCWFIEVTLWLCIGKPATQVNSAFYPPWDGQNEYHLSGWV